LNGSSFKVFASEFIKIFRLDHFRFLIHLIFSTSRQSEPILSRISPNSYLSLRFETKGMQAARLGIV
jgi:hypothetical protein